jgi:hypothetical protein
MCHLLWISIVTDMSFFVWLVSRIWSVLLQWTHSNPNLVQAQATPTSTFTALGVTRWAMPVLMTKVPVPVVCGVPSNFFLGGWGWLCQEFFSGWGSTNSVEDRGQRERGSGGSSPLVRGSTQCANEWNPYSDYVVMDVYSTELGIWLSFV